MEEAIPREAYQEELSAGPPPKDAVNLRVGPLPTGDTNVVWLKGSPKSPREAEWSADVNRSPKTALQIPTVSVNYGQTLQSVAEILGLRATNAPLSLIGLAGRIEDGLAIGALKRIAEIVAPGDAQFKYRLVPRATYARRKNTRVLSAEEGTRLARLARVWSLALDVWGDEQEARGFLFRPHAILEDKRPIDVVIQSEFGAEVVVDILGSLKYGSAA
jgi:putative toxin-antitoxin system antitoxin component (TIGR02293 family)